MNNTIQATQKKLIDFLWEWAVTRGNWCQLLVRAVTTKQSALNQTEREDVFNYYLQEIGFSFETPLPSLNITKPSFQPESQNISLTKLSEIKGVNRLAENQELDFSSNITVIYGDNGAGKTGYSRILKSLGYSFDKNNNILSDIKEPQVSPSARIDFKSDGDNFYYDWDGIHTTDELSAISVFNSNCVHFSLSSGRELLVLPQGFYLFKLVKDELEYLRQMHQNYYSHYPITLNWKEQLHLETPQSNYINNLTSASNKKQLDKLSTFTEQHKVDLVKKEKEFESLNKITLTSQLEKTSLIVNELNTVISSIKSTQSNLTKADWDNIKRNNNSLKKLQEKTQLGISALAETHGLELFESTEFSDFLKSADSYLKILNKEGYPDNENDTCIYCKQNFHTEEAKKLVDSYGKILNDTTQVEIAKIEESIREIIDKVNLIDDQITFHQPVFGTSDNESIIQPKEILEFNAKIKSLKGRIVNNTIDTTVEFDINYQSYINFFEGKRDTCLEERNNLNTKLNNLTRAEEKLKKEIAELKDKELLSRHNQEIKDCINNLLTRKKLDDNRNKFNTDSLSRKTTEARNELVAFDFQEKFKRELKRFRKQHITVDMNFHTAQGASHLNQKISNYNINDILSEGEQKAIALAEFLTELQLDGSATPVVFDDPVNSLDHHIIDDTARRLIELSKNQQVIVFTHSILLYNNFLSMSQSNYPLYNDIDFKFYKVKTQFDTTGVLSEGGEINKITEPIGKLNRLIQNAKNNEKSEEEITKQGYGFLRTALELLITDDVLQRTVKRYRKNVIMSGFPKIKGNLIEKHKETLNEIFERSSGFIDGHSNPEPISSTPNFTDLQSDFESFKRIREEFLRN